MFGGASGVSVRRNGNDIDAATILIKVHRAIAGGKQCVVTASADIFASMPFSATLTSKNVASDDGFTTKLLNPSALCLGIATVAA